MKKHSPFDYWKHGLSRAWDLPDVRNTSGDIFSICDAGNSFDGSRIPWPEKDMIDEGPVL